MALKKKPSLNDTAFPRSVTSLDPVSAAAWDSQIEEDIVAGRLDDLADEALADLRQGRCTDR